ncbi:ER membrane protein complex subunit 4 [Sinocyclocheilus anshuiensis]|uniref:ER membrane protein complex subunit 4 n=1 Tax=Sinocyclocheilus anshuiensis TaxID=1608454 RepID=UPI0007B988AD|nr:PREDICTED: ER membrane protein complex subunit 4 [Sinocyclocheilus anshuiensis]
MTSPGGGALAARGGATVKRMKWSLELSLGNSRNRGDRQSKDGDVMYPVGYSDKPVPDTSVQEADRNLVEKHKRQALVCVCVCEAFKLLESSSQQWLQGLVYLIGNLLGSALAIYKCQSMGLLPTHSSDWLAFIEPPQRLEIMGGGMVM